MAHGGVGGGECAAGVAGGVQTMLIAQTAARICLLQALSGDSRAGVGATGDQKTPKP